MLVCFKSFKSDTSLIAVQGAPSSCSSRISFRAISFPVILRERERRRRGRENKVSEKVSQSYLYLLLPL